MARNETLWGDTRRMGLKRGDPRRIALCARFSSGLAGGALSGCLVLAGVFLMTGEAMATAEIDLAVNSTFGDGMVLQRDLPLAVWGKGSPGKKVTVRIGDCEASSIADSDGCWRAVLPPLPSGGPHAISVGDGSKEILFKEVWVGEVWLCSGQSNMQYPVAETPHPETELDQASHLDFIHLYQVPKEGSSCSRESVDAKWQVCGASSLGGFSAVAWFFAKEISRSPALQGVPIGLIDCSYGGTCVEAWMSPTLLSERFAGENIRDSFLGWKPSSMYHGMLTPLIPYGVRGVLWYQGESNAVDPALYSRLFPALIREWRELWSQPNLPFLFVQLPNYAGRLDESYFTALREAQLEVSGKVAHTGMVVTLDVGEDFDLHPPDKQPVGTRLGKVARAQVYGEDIVSSGPVLQDVAYDGDHAVLHFEHRGSGLVNAAGGSELEGFMLAGEDGRYWKALARIEGDTVVATSESVPAPRFVRYAWHGAPKADLYNREGFPASPFRTDRFELSQGQLTELRPPHGYASRVYEAEVSGSGNLTRLVVDGKNFLRAQENGPSGSYFLDFFDIPMVLTRSEVVGENALKAWNLKTSVQYDFRETGLSLTLSNLREEPRTFAFFLSPEVSPASSRTDGAEDPPNPAFEATARMDGNLLRFKGADEVGPPQEGVPAAIKVQLAPLETKTVVLTFEKEE